MSRAAGEQLHAEPAAPLHDDAARKQALDVSKSFLVQAPAGSGKTELLTDRILNLLAEVDEPEQVLAITFTRGATAEMRTRVIEKLREAEAGNETVGGPAAAALRHSKERGWNLLQQPQRLRIETIDSLCLSIAHRMPLLARLGGSLRPTENAQPLYDLAAQRTFQKLGGANGELNSALEAALTLRDNNLAECERLLAEMLKRRDQWGHLFLLSGDVDWGGVRARLEKPFQDEIARVLGKMHALLSAEPALGPELMELANYACGNLEHDHDLGVLGDLSTLPDPAEDAGAQWDCLVDGLLTKENEWRKRYSKDEGFPAAGLRKGPRAAAHKERMSALANRLRAIPGLLEVLCAIRAMPAPRYDDAQWELLLNLFTALRYAVAELRVAFAEANVVDFVELGLAADMVLRAPDEGSADMTTEQGLALGEGVKHLLVDEFQDTSRRQHLLLGSLLRGWDNCDGRTCFFVGDPMQSIYLFRQAEVELFHLVSRHGLTCHDAVLGFKTLTLQTNFRSHDGLVTPLNHIFESVFGAAEIGAVDFTPSVAHQARAGSAVHIHADVLPASPTKGDKQASRECETQQVLAVVKKHWLAVERARQTSGRFTIGVLVRAKIHARKIATELREAGLPFRSVDLETLGDRQEIIDLVALTRALLHPMDRIAWLSVLRAPWCGLELRDLHELCGTDVREGANPSVFELLETHIDKLSTEGRQRALAVRAVLTEALSPGNRVSASVSFPSLVERTWHGLGGPLCVDATGYANAQEYFGMLDELDRSGVAVTSATIAKQLQRLSAQPDPEASEHAGIQLMTIHKAKGRGFDVVIVPGLDRGTGQDGQSLICWLQRVAAPAAGTTPGDEDLVAPLGEKGNEASRLYKWIQGERGRRETEERKRLLYVACTRAREELHLLGTATNTSSGLKATEKRSLLATAWPALESYFQAAVLPAEVVRARPEAFPDNLIVLHRVEQPAPEEGEIDLAAAAETEDAATLGAEEIEGQGTGREGFNQQAPERQGTQQQGAEQRGSGQRGTGQQGMWLRRLPLDLSWEQGLKNVTATVPYAASAISSVDLAGEGPALFNRPEGSLAARALGIAVHAMLQRASRLLQREMHVDELRDALPRWRKSAVSILRAEGLTDAGDSSHARAGERDQRTAEALADRTIQAVRATVSDPVGLWILGPRRKAQSEVAWTGWLDGGLRTLRVDRLFLAGGEPLSEGDECLWIVDYKTASHSASDVDEFMKVERSKYEQQLEAYGRMLRLAKGSSLELRLGLYYPFLQRLEHWSA